MGSDSGQNTKNYEVLAELARANVSGPMGYKMVSKLQRSLVRKMAKKGLISEEDANSLEM